MALGVRRLSGRRPRGRSRFPVLDQDGPIAMAHRGFSLDGLENSMAAFGAAVDLGLNYLETDVHASADGRLLAFHDDRLDRVTDAQGVIAELPWARLREARIGGREPIPLLEDVLGTWPDVRLNIDVKAKGAIRPLVEVIRRTNALDRVIVASFSGRRRAAVRRALGPRLATSAGPARIAAWRLLGWDSPRGDAARVALHSVAALQVPVRARHLEIVTAASVQRAHNSGVQVHVWTINEATEMHRLLDLGVDGLITDRSDTLRKVFIERGIWTR